MINEELSVSNDVIAKKNQILSVIIDKLDKKDYETSYKERRERLPDGSVEYERIPSKIITVDAENDAKFGELNRIIVYAYDFDNVEAVSRNAQLCDFGGTSDITRGLLTVNTFSVKNILRLHDIESTLTHELEHFRQSTSNTTHAYLTAIRMMESETEFSDRWKLAWVIYYFSQKETDAHIHQLYMDLYQKAVNNIKDVNKCPEIAMYHQLREYGDAIIETDKAQLRALLAPYRTKVGEFISWYKMAVKYFETKKLKVIQRYFNELNGNTNTLFVDKRRVDEEIKFFKLQHLR